MKIIGNESIDVGVLNAYKRASSVCFYNPKDQQQYIAVTEETVIDGDVNSAILNIDIGKMRNIVINVSPELKIPLIDSSTGKESSKFIDIPDVNNILYSIYVFAYNLKDGE